MALAEVDRLPLEGYHAWHATRADLLRRLGRTGEARAAYDAAIAAAGNPAERAWLARRRRPALADPAGPGGATGVQIPCTAPTSAYYRDISATVAEQDQHREASWDTDSGATSGVARLAADGRTWRPGRTAAGRGRPGPPPWLAGLFGLVQPEPPRGPRVKRGDVRAAILDVLAVEPLNGYQVIQQIAERTGGQWKPSPGSVYPTICQLEDEGLIAGDEERGRTLRLTPEGEAYVAEHPDELAAVWAPFDDEPPVEDGPDLSVLKSEVGPADVGGLADPLQRHRPAAQGRDGGADRDPAQALRAARRRGPAMTRQRPVERRDRPTCASATPSASGRQPTLAEHYAVGRLDQDEHSERLDRIWAARTRAELDPVFADLPGHARPRRSSHRYAARRGPAPRRRPAAARAARARCWCCWSCSAWSRVVTNLPLILVGLGVWFFFLRGGCGSGSRGSTPPSSSDAGPLLRRM